MVSSLFLSHLFRRRHPTKRYQNDSTFWGRPTEPTAAALPVWKRSVDIACCLVALPALGLATLFAAIMVRIYSPGPVFFRQERIGYRGHPFMIYKFRTMHDRGADRSREGEQAKQGDARVFSFGQFLRKTSMDEFPQFINVLFGSMSAIGPRPHLIQHDDEFSEQVNIYRNRHFVKPGITGLAQCKGFRGEVTELKLIEERVRYDLQYIRNWSFWLDLWILAKTAVQIFKPPNSAY